MMIVAAVRAALDRLTFRARELQVFPGNEHRDREDDRDVERAEHEERVGHGW